MKFQGSVVKEQGLTFAITIVKPHVLNSDATANKTIFGFARFFPGIPVVLMAQDSRGTPTYYGRKDIVAFLSKIDYRRIPWKEYTAAA